MPAVSKKQQRFFGMVRAAQKGEGASSPEVAKVAASMKKKDAKDFASTKHKGLPMKKEEFINEEDYDRMKDRRMERGGVGGNKRYDRPPAKKLSNAELGIKPGKTQLQKDMEKKHGAGKSALDIVKAEIRKKHGKGAVMGEAANRAEYEKIAKERAPKDDKKAAYAFKDNKDRQRDLKKLARLVKHADGQKRNPAMYNSFEPEGEQISEAPYQVYGSPDGKKEKKIGKPVKSKKYAADRAAELEDTHKKTGGKYRSEYTEAADFWHPDPDKDRKLGGPGANQRAREDRAAASKPKSDPKKLKPGESYMDYAKRQKSGRSTKYSPELQKRIDAAKAKKKEGIVGKIARKVGLKKESTEGKSFKQFLEEGNRTGRMMQKSKSQVTGHISADRGDDEKKNREGRKTLEKDLKKHGIGHKKGVGEYKYGSGETGREVSYQTSKPDKMSKRRFGKVMRRLGRKHGQESVITKDKEKSAKLHYTEKGSKAKSDSIGKTKAGKHPEGYGETSGTKVRGGKLPKKTNKGAYHYG